MPTQLRDVASPVTGEARAAWDAAVDAALRREHQYSWWLESFQNPAGTLTDRQMLEAAWSAAAAQTQPPVIKLGPRDHNFSKSASTGLNGFPGAALAGPRNHGLGTVEQGSAGAACRVLADVGSGTQSFFYINGGGAGASIYSPLVCNDIAWRSTNSNSQWLHAPFSAVNMYGPVFGNLSFTQFKHVLGQPNDAMTATLFAMWGAWNIPNMAGTPMSLRGSDNWLLPTECNVGWNAGPAGQYLMRLENVQKTFIENFYWTCRQGGTRALLVDNQGSQTQGGLFVSNCVIEGQNLGEPAPGALVYVNSNGVVNLSDCTMNFAMANPTAPGGTDTAYIMAVLGTHGLLNVHDITITRATGVSQDVPFVAQTGGGKVYAERIFGMPGNGGGQLWTDLPAARSTAGEMHIDKTLRMVA